MQNTDEETCKLLHNKQDKNTHIIDARTQNEHRQREEKEADTNNREKEENEAGT